MVQQGLGGECPNGAAKFRAVIFKTPESIFPSADRSSKIVNVIGAISTLLFFPSLQGGPHNIHIAALAIALKQVAIQENKAYIEQIKKNSQVLTSALLRRKCRLVTGGTDNHLLLWDLTPLGTAHASMQYDMHASSFQRDITTSQQGAKTNGAPEYCTRVSSPVSQTEPLLGHSQMKHTLRLKKTWQEATKSSVPRMVGNLVYRVSPVSAALSVGRREFYVLFVEEGLDFSSIHRKKEARKSFEKVIKLSEKLK
ncbi:hypothetical protein YC2023_094069 [Brassica napus]